ncbi:tRNA pseudouridine13 synthase [Strigomonas culicis]|uniref:tRNA pseudouridine13 synthase n=1 Tax=Strigomonas culicis TaxID=28005 RepID=S9U4F6_9TRYP|nr:tRNA pseudouridine13 synthase [Strigomonas culicis]|eukprot:EPY23654.1 tRNA pseudouridine13 synthase [Strigomonas culicis]
MRQLLSHHLQVQEGQVCVAGMKDKRAITWQRCSAPAAAAALPTLLRWPSDPQHSYVVLHASSHARGVVYPAPIQLGQLRGNYFEITVRDVRGAGSAAAAPARALLERRLRWVAAHGFINYFGQQRFSESVRSLQDHTGLLLVRGRYVAAVRSLYRGCPALYDEHFPDRMDARHVPGSARDAQAITQALKQACRQYFQDGARQQGEGPLTRDDVAHESPRWQRICERAITAGVPYALRSMWVHAAQSLYFNVTASCLAARLQEGHAAEGEEAEEEATLLLQLQLPLGGYRMAPRPLTATGAAAARLEGLVGAASTQALAALALSREALYEQRRVAGVPLSGGCRHFLVRPTEAHLGLSAAPLSTGLDLQARFFLPSSSYATVLLREIFGNDVWW